jgi:hypothetical protein
MASAFSSMDALKDLKQEEEMSTCKVDIHERKKSNTSKGCQTNIGFTLLDTPEATDHVT